MDQTFVETYYIFVLFLVSVLNYAQTKHTVTKGETLYSISKKYNITSLSELQELVKKNKLPDLPDTIKKGILYYDKYKENIPRSEIDEIHNYLYDIIKSIDFTKK